MVVTVNNEAAREDLLVCDNVGSPIQGVAAIVDGAAALGLFVDGAEKLPFRCAHLGARAGATRGRIKQEANNERVALRYEEAAQLVEPDGTVDAGWRLCELESSLSSNGLCVGGGMVAVESGEVFLELEGRVELLCKRKLVGQVHLARMTNLMERYQRRTSGHVRSFGTGVYAPLGACVKLCLFLR